MSQPTCARIHRDHLLHNFQLLQTWDGFSGRICAAVKANAYGHGAVGVATLLERAGCDAFSVARVEEGQELRAAGIQRPILLLGTVLPEQWSEVVAADLEPFIFSATSLQDLGQSAQRAGKIIKVHLKVDTGMGRLGCPPEQAGALARSIAQHPYLELEGVCTHLASSDVPGPVTVEQQLERFGQAQAAISAEGLNPRWVHAANSDAVLHHPQARFSMIRPGIALYGYAAADLGLGAKLLPVMELVSRVGFVKTVAAGTPLSYGSRYCTKQTTDVATIPIGYADGYRRSLSNRAPLKIGNRSFQVSGTVCMDQLMVDLGPHSGVCPGDPVVLFGPQRPAPEVSPPTAADLARLADTISYELLCGIAARVPRIEV